jgi:energy-coupling factor transporter ATP-binding protein EcfA2
MAIFDFDASYTIGKVRAVDTRRVNVQVNSDEDLRKAGVGQLVALQLPGAIEEWLIGIIDKVVKTPVYDDDSIDDETGVVLPHESIMNTVHLTLVGTVGLTIENKTYFSRSLVQVPEIDCKCNILRDAQLQTFMNLLSVEGHTEHSLELGCYTIDESAKAYLDGNKLFQRHASILGSTGSGKSWTVASVLEQAAKLPSSNLVVFDLHGEYRKLSYARHLRIPGPEELSKKDDSLLYLPYWLLNTEELQAMFIDRSEYTAHNQVTVFQNSVISEKKKFLESLKKTDILESFTLDSPIPFKITDVINELDRLNNERIPGAKAGTEKNGPFNGDFSRLLVRLNSKITDKRYGFLFQTPDTENKYESMS